MRRTSFRNQGLLSSAHRIPAVKLSPRAVTTVARSVAGLATVISNSDLLEDSVSPQRYTLFFFSDPSWMDAYIIYPGWRYSRYSAVLLSTHSNMSFRIPADSGSQLTFAFQHIGPNRGPDFGDHPSATFQPGRTED